ncbi:MAG: amidohydrolase family protein, partial [Sphingobium sp.]
YGLMLLTLDLSATANLAEAQAKIAAQIKDNPDRKWILGRGWDAARWNLGRTPTTADLDSVTGVIPAFLLSADGELRWANSAALRAAGLAKITGPLNAAQVAQLRRLVPQPSARDRDTAFEKAQRALLANGVTAVSDIGMTINDWQSYRRAGDRGALRMRIIGYADGVEQMVAIAGPEPTPWLYDDRLRMVGVTFTLDGTIGSRTAWMKQPPTRSARIASTPLRNQMSRAAMDGFQINLIAHGDAAVDEAIDAFAEMSATYSGDRRWRIGGVEVLDATDAARFASGQVTPVLSDSSISQPPLLPLRQNPHLAIGSFAPSVPPSPFAIIARMVTEHSDVGSALNDITRNPARAAFAETRLGALEPGQSGDFLLIDQDISAASSQDIAAAKVLETWIGGRRVYVNAPSQ